CAVDPMRRLPWRGPAGNRDTGSRPSGIRHRQQFRRVQGPAEEWRATRPRHAALPEPDRRPDPPAFLLYPRQGTRGARQAAQGQCGGTAPVALMRSPPLMGEGFCGDRSAAAARHAEGALGDHAPVHLAGAAVDPGAMRMAVALVDELDRTLTLRQ